MGKEKTPSFILELPLMLSPEQEHILQTRFDAGRQMYNAVLGEALKRLRLIRQSKAFQKACQLPKGSETRRKAFQALNEQFGFSAYALHPYAAERWHKWRREQLDSLTVQAIATRAFAAVQKYAFGKHGKPRFKGYHQFDSLEGKTNTSGIRWQGDRVVWLGTEFPAPGKICAVGAAQTEQESPVLRATGV